MRLHPLVNLSVSCLVSNLGCLYLTQIQELKGMFISQSAVMGLSFVSLKLAKWNLDWNSLCLTVSYDSLSKQTNRIKIPIIWPFVVDTNFGNLDIHYNKQRLNVTSKLVREFLSCNILKGTISKLNFIQIYVRLQKWTFWKIKQVTATELLTCCWFLRMPGLFWWDAGDRASLQACHQAVTEFYSLWVVLWLETMYVTATVWLIVMKFGTPEPYEVNIR